MLEPFLAPSLADVLVTAFPDCFETCFDLLSGKADFSSPLLLLTGGETRLPFDRRGYAAVIVGRDAISGDFGAIVGDLLRNIFVICQAFSCLPCRCCLIHYTVLKKSSSRFDKVEIFELIEFAMKSAWIAPMNCWCRSLHRVSTR